MVSTEVLISDPCAWGAWVLGAPKGHVNRRSLHPGFKAQEKGDSGNHGF